MRKSICNGLLIVIEGIDGSGKTTQVELLKEWLGNKGFAVMKSEWYRTQAIYDLNMRLTLAGEITAKAAFTLVAAEFAARLEYVLKPALAQGYIVLCEKYIYTPMAKDVARGADTKFVRLLYQHAPVPDIVFYLDVDVEIALSRIQNTRKLQFWESGMDMFFDGKRVNEGLQLYYEGKVDQRAMANGFRRFQSKVSEEYKKLAEKFQMVVIDRNKGISQQQEIIRTQVAELVHRHSLEGNDFAPQTTRR